MGVGDFFGDVWDKGTDLLEDGWKTLGNGLKTIEAGGKTIVNAIGDGTAALLNLAHDYIGFRGLRPSERAVLYEVFGSSINPDRLVICSLAGPTGRPLTFAGLAFELTAASICPALGPVMLVGSLINELHSKYILCLGPNGYNDAINYRMKYRSMNQRVLGQALVHEMTHAWQGIHYLWAQYYMCDSIEDQIEHIFEDRSAYYYYYKEFRQFDEYRVEQQASIVDDWYNFLKTGQTERRAALDPYITYNIRTGNPKATAVVSKASPLIIGGVASVDVGKIVSHVPPMGSLKFQPAPMTKAQADALLYQAAQLRAQGESMLRSGNPFLAPQGQVLLANAQQIEAAVEAAGFPVRRIGMPGANAITSTLGTRQSMPGAKTPFKLK